MSERHRNYRSSSSTLRYAKESVRADSGVMATPFTFTLTATEGRSRVGQLATPHGLVPTPAFLPVASQGSVKSLTPQEVRSLGASILLGNAYHLYLRPETEVVEEMGGLHKFMAWDGPILTDSGGFQAFSMGSLTKVHDDGIVFRSHIDGSEHRMTPEDAIRIQASLGSDVAMCFDQCIAYGEPEQQVRAAMERTHRWAARCKQAHQGQDRQALFGIVQGGVFSHLRRESVEYITSLGFDGYAIGGLAVGESKAQMYEIADQVSALLPVEKPRYLMGVGSPEDLVEGVAHGIDIFDCALPTRVARNGALFTPEGRVDVTKSIYQYQSGPIDDGCDCYTCCNFSTAYLRHLFKAGELLALRLATIHNLRYILRLMENMREAIGVGQFLTFRAAFQERYRPADEPARLAQIGRRPRAKSQ